MDFLGFVDYDRYVSDEGKARGSGTRTIHCQELPTHWAKSRMLSEPIPFVQNDPVLWQQLFNINPK